MDVSREDDGRPAPDAREPSPGMAVGGWLAAAAAILLLIVAGAYAARLRGRLDAAHDELAQGDAERARLVTALARRDSMLADVAGPGVRVIDLTSAADPGASGRVFRDPATGRWTLFVHGMPLLTAARDYQLWLVTPSGPVSAGTFRTTPDGEGALRATHPLPPDSLRGVAVTQEPDGGSPKPTGTPIIAANVSG